MTHPRLSGNRWCPRAMVVVMAAAALLVGDATAAQAHNVLVSTSPADGATLKVVPAQVTLTFSEPAVAVGTEVIVTGPAGHVQTGAAVLVNNTVSERLSQGSPAGLYKVVWRVVSADGHPVSGTFTFTATVASTGQRATATTATSAPITTPASVSGQSPALWWGVAGVLVVLVLLVVFAWMRKPRSTADDERDPTS